MKGEWATVKQRRAEERARSEAEAAKDAAEMWAAAGPARADHAYLVKKGISTHHFRQSADKVLVPMFDGDGHHRNLQRIGPGGSKPLLRGGLTRGHFFSLGEFTDTKQ